MIKWHTNVPNSKGLCLLVSLKKIKSCLCPHQELEEGTTFYPLSKQSYVCWFKVFPTWVYVKQVTHGARPFLIQCYNLNNLGKRVGLGGSVGCAVRLETRRSRVQPPPRSATFFRGDWSRNMVILSLPARPFLIQCYNLNNLGKRPLDKTKYQMSKAWAFKFQTRRFCLWESMSNNLIFL